MPVDTSPSSMRLAALSACLLSSTALTEPTPSPSLATKAPEGAFLEFLGMVVQSEHGDIDPMDLHDLQLLQSSPLTKSNPVPQPPTSTPSKQEGANE